MSSLIVALVFVALQLIPINNTGLITIPSSIAEEESVILKPSNVFNQKKDLLLADDDDTTNVNKPSRLKNSQFGEKIKLVGNK